MQISYEKVIGNTKFTITETAETHEDFFKKVSFFTTLPTEGPNGETDLKLVHRKTQQGYNYYSIVSESAKKEFKLGLSNQEKGAMFPKGWEDLYVEEDETNVAQPKGLGNSQTVNPQVNNQETSQTVTPQVKGLGSTQMPTPQVNGLGSPQTVNPQSAPTQSPVPGANTQAVNSVLAKYGIKQQ